MEDLKPHKSILSFEEEVVLPSLAEGLGATVGGEVGNTLASSVSKAINNESNLIKDVVNARLDTSSKKILSDFTFGSADYSGAFKTGDITWNATTGEITGGSGAVFNKKGLIFATAGVATITLDGETGSAVFAGTLSAVSGTFGTITTGALEGAVTLGGRSGTILAGAINTSGNLIKDITNARLDSSTKQILDGFKLTSSGALNISGTQTVLTASAAVGATSITVSSTTGFPTSGVLYLQGNTNWMRITYTGTAATTFTGIPASGGGSVTEAADSGKQVIGGPGVIITPKGLVAINSSGIETITLEGSAGNATFAGTLSAAAGTLGTITAGTLTGLTIQTADSGQRISIGAKSEGLKVYNTDGVNIALLQPTDSGTLLSATSPNTASRMFQFISFTQNGYNANPMVYLEAADVSTGTPILSLVQKGALSAQTIDLTATSTGNGLVITHLGDGMCGDFYINNTNSNNYAVRVRSTASAIDALYAEHTINTMTPAHFKQTGAVVANTHNYYRVLKLNGGGITKSIWISDGNSPNTDALSGGIGDICLNCDSGEAYYNNNGSTGWTAM